MKPARFLLAPVKALIVACHQQTRAIIVIGGAGYSIFPKFYLAPTVKNIIRTIVAQ